MAELEQRGVKWRVLPWKEQGAWGCAEENLRDVNEREREEKRAETNPTETSQV